jgi:predicted enzyme involved in methoxymalonyl-ACP biosynthesis
MPAKQLVFRHSAEIADHVQDDQGSASEAFLQSLDAKLTFQFQPDPGDVRPLELVNKTNQFI